MNFEPDGELATFLAFVERISARYRNAWVPAAARFEHAAALERDLQASGFFGAANEGSLGLLAATAMVLELSKLPQCAELTASSLVGPLVCPDRPRPLAVIWGAPDRPVRFLPVARTVLAVQDDVVRVAGLHEGDVQSANSLFAYPMGRLKAPDALPWQALAGVRPDEVRKLWRLGVGAEIAGSLLGALESVVAHVTGRRQFGRPLGSLQAIQHRLASSAALIEGTRWLVFRAAASGAPADTIAAVASAQAMATGVVYDLHQFMGAMGLTLEHPLHRWTYRVRLLRSELGGAEQHFQALADLVWNPALQRN
jgi:hypothetical protein